MSQIALHSARPTPLPALLNPFALVAGLWGQRELTWQFAVRFFHLKHRGTHLGVVWALAFPLMMLAVYTFVFNYVFSARFGVNPDETRSQFAVLLFAGITTYAIFSETVTGSCGLVLDHTAYVKKVVFPLEILPLAKLGSALLFSSFGYGLTLIGTWVFFGRVPWTVLLLPLVLLPMLALALGLAWFVASLSVFVRDVANIVTIVVSQLLFFMTPVFYRIENLPEEWRGVAHANPLAPVVEGVRAVLTGGSPDFAALGVVLLIGLCVVQLGYAWFMKSKRGFADVL